MAEQLYKNIAFCTDFSENADEAFVTARDLAERYDATLHILHVMINFSLSPPTHATYMPIEYDPSFVEKVKEAAMETIQDRYIGQMVENQRHKIHLLGGYAATEILKMAQDQDMDLIVMGSRGLTGLAHVLFGSTADRVVRKAPCSVLTVRLKKSEEE